MRAVLYTDFGVSPAVVDLPEPTCPPDGAVIRVEATGLCRSDWHGWRGNDPDIRVPHVPGHEFAGTIEAVGAEVRNWAAGERVTVPFVCACGICGPCLAGDQQVCDNQFQSGFTHWGSFAEFVSIGRADVNLVRLPDGLDFVTAASLGCRFATAYRAVIAQGRLVAGEWVAVHGCGGVGLSAVMIAVDAGARVVAVDVSESALAAASALGAEVVVDGSAGEVAARVIAATGGGAHLSVDALGSTQTCLNSIGSLRKRGRHIQVGLMVDADARPAIPMGAVIARELEILGSHGMAAHEYPSMLGAVASGDFRPIELVGRRITLDEVPEALAAMGAAGGAGSGMTVVEL
jgi:D-arabinose 1-dehydrogenase-like Zn-dependent alcohol dehydrogenase